MYHRERGTKAAVDKRLGASARQALLACRESPGRWGTLVSSTPGAVSYRSALHRYRAANVGSSCTAVGATDIA